MFSRLNLMHMVPDVGMLLRSDAKICTYKEMRVQVKLTNNPFIQNLFQMVIDRCCHQCGATENDLKRCSQCFVARYCSRECQLIHWKAGHRDVCKGKI